MNIFNFFIRNNNEVTAYFKDGILYKVTPDIGDLYENRDIYYNARYIVTDGIKFDLENKKSIKRIPTPYFDNFSNSSLGITGNNLVYVLRMKASALKNENKIDEALILLKRATEMMPNSKVGWTKKEEVNHN